MQRNASTHSFLEWMTHKINESPALEDLLADEIVEKLSHASATPPPPHVATFAFQSGHKKLALKLLDCDPEPIRRVQSLLEWREYRAAFVEASESGNPDLIYTVTLKLHDKMAADEFSATIDDFPMATTLYKKYCDRFDVPNLYEIYRREEDHSAQAQLLIKQALDENNSHMASSLLTSAADAYKKSGDQLHASMCEDQSLLLNFQKQMNERHAHSPYKGKTVQETCALLMIEKPNMAEEFRSVFQIPERRYWRLRLRTMADLGHWAGLEKLWKGKKCPLGPEAFVDACLNKGNIQEASKYLVKVDERLKVKYFVKVGYFEEAAQLALKKKDHQGIQLVRRMCQKDPILIERINCFVVKMDEANCQMWRSFSL